MAEQPLHRQLGRTDDELSAVIDELGREPTHLELAMYSVMWSEHCSYKSSRPHLGRFPTEAPWVLVAPGEGAGVIDIGDGIAVAVRIERPTHPSAVGPYRGAASGRGPVVPPTATVRAARPGHTVGRRGVGGPALTVVPYDGGDAAAWAIANGPPCGLSGAVWASDQDRALTFARRMRTGQVGVNGGVFNPTAPFGGFGQSGYGRELGPLGLAEFTAISSLQV